MRFLILLLMILAITSPAHAAAVASVASGNWNNGAIWDSGVVPTTGDDVSVVHYLTVPDGVDLTADSIDIDASGSVIFQGTSSVSCDIDVDHASAYVTVNRDAVVTLNTAATPALHLTASGATLTVYGKLLMGAASEGAVNRVFINSAAGTTVNAQGRALSSTANISSIDLTAQTTSDNLVVTLDRAAPSNSTHAIVKSGRYKGMIWPISSGQGTTSVTLDGPLTQAYNALNTIDSSDSAFDSILVNDATTTPDPWKSPGAFVLSSSGKLEGQIEKVFEASTANHHAFFVDHEAVSITGTDPAYILTSGVAQGTALGFLEMAQLWGANDAPSTDNTTNGVETTGKDECRRLVFDGSVDADYAEFRWIGSSSTTDGITLNTAASTYSIKGSLFYQPASRYLISTTGSTTIQVSDSSFFNALGPRNGNHGHWFYAKDATSDAATFTVEDCVAVGLNDDFMFCEEGGTFTMSRNSAFDWGVANFIDFGANCDSVIATLSNNLVRVNETPIKAEALRVNLTTNGNRIVAGGNALGRATIAVDHLAGDGNAIGYIGTGGSGGFSTLSANADTVSWSMWRSIALSNGPAAADTLRFNNVILKNYINYTEPGSVTWTKTNNNMYGAKVTGNDPIVFDGCQFRNPWRRGWNLATWPFNTANIDATAIGVKPSSATFVDIRRCTFHDSQSMAEGLIFSADEEVYWVQSSTNWSGGGISGSLFDGVSGGFFHAGGTLSIHHNLFLPPAATPPSNRVVAGRASGANLVLAYNTFVRDMTGTPGFYIFSSQGLTLTGNLLLDTSAGTGQMMVHWTAGGMAASTINYNRIASAHADPWSDNTVDKTTTEMEAIATATGNSATEGTADAWASDVGWLDHPILLDTSAAVDLVTGSTDPDGTAADAGYIALDKRRWK